MCDPVSATVAIGTALSVGSGFLQQQQAGKNQAGLIRARNQSNLDEVGRQNQKRAESEGVFGEAVDRFEGGNAKRREADATSKREQAILSNIRPDIADFTPGGGEGAGPDIVKGEVARRISGALGAGKDNARNLARLGGAADFNFGNLLNLGRTGGRLSEISDLSAGSAALLPIEQQTAVTNAFNPPSPFLDVAKGVGQGVQAFGFAGAPGLPTSGTQAPALVGNFNAGFT